MPFIRIAGKAEKAENSIIYFDNENHFAYGIHTRYKNKKGIYLRCVYRNTKKCKARCLVKQRENTHEWELQRVRNSHSHPPEPDYLETNKIKKPEKEVILTGNEVKRLIFDEEGKKVKTVTPAKCKCNEMQTVISNKQKRILQSSHRSVDDSESSGDRRVTRNSLKISKSKVPMYSNSEELKIKIRVTHGSSSKTFHIVRNKTKFSSKTARDPSSESESTFDESSAAPALPTPDFNSQFKDVNSDLLTKDFSVKEGTVKFLEVVAKDPNLASEINTPYQDLSPQSDSNQETPLVTEGDLCQISKLDAEKSSAPTSHSTETEINLLIIDGKIPEENSKLDSSAKQPTIQKPFRSFRLISMNQNPSAAEENRAESPTSKFGFFISSPPPLTTRLGCPLVNQKPGMESASRMSYDLGDSGQNVASNIHGTFPGKATLLVPNPGFQFLILVPDTEGQTEIRSTQAISLNQCIPAIAGSQGETTVITFLRPVENFFQCDENGVSPLLIVPGTEAAKKVEASMEAQTPMETEAGKKAEASLEAQTPMDGGSNKHRLRLKRQWKLNRERRLKHRLRLKRQWKLERERRLKHLSSIEAQTPMETEAGKKAEASMETEAGKKSQASMEAKTPMQTDAGKNVELSMETQTPIETEAGKKAEASIEPQTPMETGAEKKAEASIAAQTPMETAAAKTDEASIEAETPMETEAGKMAEASIEAQTSIETEASMEAKKPMETEAGKKAEASIEAQTPKQTEAGKKAEASFEAQTPMETEAEKKAEASIEAQTPMEIEAGKTAEASIEAQTSIETEAGKKAEASMEAEAENKAEASMAAETPMETEAEKKAEASIESQTPIKTEAGDNCGASMEAGAGKKAKPSMEAQTPMETEAGKKAEASIEAQTRMETEAGKKAEASMEAEAEKKAEASIEAQTPMETEAGKKVEASIEAQTVMETEAGKKAEASIEAKTPIETEAGKKVEASIEAQTLMETKARKKAEASIEAKSPMETEARKKAEALMEAQTPMETEAGKRAEGSMEAQTLTETEAGKKAEASIEAKTPIETEAGKKAQPSMEAQTPMETEAGKKAEASIEAQTRMETEAGKKAEASMEAEAEKKAEASIEAQTPMETEAGKKVEASIEAQTRMETEAGEKAEASIEAQTLMETEAGKKVEASMEAELEKRAEALMEAQTVMETEAGNKVEASIEAQTGMETEAGMKAEASIEGQTPMETEAGKKAEASMEAQTPMETEAGKKAEASIEAQSPLQTEARKKAEALMEAQTLMETEAGKKAEASIEAQTLIETEAGKKAEASIEAKTPIETEAGKKAEASIEAQTLMETEAGKKAEASIEAKSPMETEARKKADASMEAQIPMDTEALKEGIRGSREAQVTKKTQGKREIEVTIPDSNHEESRTTESFSMDCSAVESVDLSPQGAEVEIPKNTSDNAKFSSTPPLQLTPDPSSQESSFESVDDPPKKRARKQVNWGERLKGSSILEIKDSKKAPNTGKSQKTGLKRGRKRKNNLVSESERNPKVVKKNESEEYVIDKIIGYHRDNKQNENWYLITWKGFPETHKTWEQIENLTNCNYMLMKYFEYEKPTEEKMSEIAKEIDDSLVNYTMYQNLIDSNFQKKYLDEFSKTCLDLSPLFTGDRVHSFLYKIETQYSYIIRTLIGMYNHRDWRMFQRGQNYNICIRICKRRMEQLKQLHKIERNINRLESCFIKVENNVDLEHFPENVEYIPEMRLGKDIAVPERSLIGCSCKNVCNEKTVCCGKKLYHKSAYNENGLLTLPEGSLIYECNSHCKCDKSCPNRVVQQGRKVKLAIFKTKSSGWGVKVLEKVPKGTFICEYIGELIKDSEAVVRYVAYVQEGFSYLFDLDFNPEINDEKLHCIDSTFCGNVSRFLNHSCDPNLEVCPVWIDWLEPDLPRVAFFAKREINEGEEIRLQYSRNAEAASPGRYRNTTRIVSNQKCVCGAANCRKWIF